MQWPNGAIAVSKLNCAALPLCLLCAAGLCAVKQGQGQSTGNASNRPLQIPTRGLVFTNVTHKEENSDEISEWRPKTVRKGIGVAATTLATLRALKSATPSSRKGYCPWSPEGTGRGIAGSLIHSWRRQYFEPTGLSLSLSLCYCIRFWQGGQKCWFKMKAGSQLCSKGSILRCISNIRIWCLRSWQSSGGGSPEWVGNW